MSATSQVATYAGSGLAVGAGVVAQAANNPAVTDGAISLGVLGIIMAVGGMITTWAKMYFEHKEKIGFWENRIATAEQDAARNRALIDKLSAAVTAMKGQPPESLN